MSGGAEVDQDSSTGTVFHLMEYNNMFIIIIIIISNIPLDIFILA